MQIEIEGADGLPKGAYGARAVMNDGETLTLRIDTELDPEASPYTVNVGYFS